MKKLSIEFLTKFISEQGSQSQNKDYFGFVALDDFACYAIAEGYDNAPNIASAKLAVDTVLENYTKKPTLSAYKLKKYVQAAHQNLVQQSTVYHLKASILIVATDYKHVRVVSCGSCHVNIFRAGGEFYHSRDQSLYWDMVTQGKIPNDGTKGMEESRNMLSYLGIKGRIDIEVSKKLTLLDDDVMVLSTWGFWEKVNAIEMLDALEECKEPQQYLDELHELFLSKQQDGLNNHTIASVFVNKTFTDQGKRKKLIKMILIASLVVLFVAIIIIIVIYFRYTKRVESVLLIASYETRGSVYMDEENFERAISEYANAMDEGKNLTQRLGKRGRANTDIKAIVDSKQRVATLIADGDGLFENERYTDAKRTYVRALDAFDTDIRLVSNARYIYNTEEQEKLLYVNDRFFFRTNKTEFSVYPQVDIDALQEKVKLCEYLEMEQKIDGLLMDGDKWFNDGRYDRAVKSYEDAIKAAEAYTGPYSELFDGMYLVAIEDKIAFSRNTKEMNDLIMTGDLQANLRLYEMALSFYISARGLALKLRDTDALNDISFKINQVESILKQMKDDAEADAVAFATAAKAAAEAEDEERQTKFREVAVLAERFALQAESAGSYEAALSYYKEAIENYIQAGDMVAVIDAEMKRTNVQMLMNEQDGKTQLAVVLNMLKIGDEHLTQARKENDVALVDLAMEKYREAYESFIRMNEPDEAIKASEKIEQARGIKKEIEDLIIAEEAKKIDKEGDDLFGRGEYGEALEKYRDALRLYRSIRDEGAIEELEEKIGFTDEIVRALGGAIDQTEHDRRMAEGESREKTGDFALRTGDTKLALEMYSQAYDIYISINAHDKASAVEEKILELQFPPPHGPSDNEKEIWEYRAKSREAEGDRAFERGIEFLKNNSSSIATIEFGQAIKSFEEALAYYRMLEDYAGILRVESKIDNARNPEHYVGRPPDGVEYYWQQMQLAEVLEKRGEEAITINLAVNPNKTVIFREDYDYALRLFNEARDIYRSLNEQQHPRAIALDEKIHSAQMARISAPLAFSPTPTPTS